MTIAVQKLTDESLMRKACAVTNGKTSSKTTLEQIYKCEHSPIRSQIFWVEMYDIPSFVSVHLVRHKVGVEHFVKSLRDDRCGEGNETRNSPVNHCMLINAQALINMARKRLCTKSHKETRKVMREIKMAIRNIDFALFERLVPDCEYRNGCYEMKSCGEYPEGA